MTRKILISCFMVAVAGMAVASNAVAAAYSIAEDQLDQQKIYFGNSAEFSSPARVKIDDLLKATPEYDEIKKKNIERGTGKYWILVSQAQERAQQAINEVAQETDYDLICEDGYLSGLEPSIDSADITDTVLEKISD